MPSEKTTKTIQLTPDEVRLAVRQYLKLQHEADVAFRVGAVYDQDDWRGEFGHSYALKEVVVTYNV